MLGWDTKRLADVDYVVAIIFVKSVSELKFEFLELSDRLEHRVKWSCSYDHSDKPVSIQPHHQCHSDV